MDNLEFEQGLASGLKIGLTGNLDTEIQEELQPNKTLEPVRIICSANHYRDSRVHVHQPRNIATGFVVCGRRHHNCINTFTQIVSFPYSEQALTIKRTETQGFLTNTNLFVDRKLALLIALHAKQLIHSKYIDPNVGLTSEDIY